MLAPARRPTPLLLAALFGACLCALAWFAIWRAPDAPHDEPAAPLRPQPQAPASTPGPDVTRTVLDAGEPDHVSAPVHVDAHERFVVDGLARTHHGAPAANADLALELVVDENARPRALGRAASDDSGRFRFELAELDALDANAAELVIRARAPGFQPATSRRSLADVLARAGATKTCAWSVVFVPGQVLRGRALDAAARPVAGADVRLIAPSARGQTHVTSVVARATSGPDGRFEHGYASSGTYELSARGDGAGTAHLAGLALVATNDMDLGDLTLNGAGRIAGRAIRPDGAPVRGLELWALAAEERPGRNGNERANTSGTSLAAARSLEERETDDGLVWARTETDAEGRFAVTGLRPGGYVLVSPRAGARIDPRSARCTTPATDVVLHVASAELAVFVHDENGAPVPRAVVSWTRLARAGDGEVPASARASTSTDAAGRATFEVDGDGAYVLRAESGARVVEERVTFPASVSTVEREIVLPSASGSGWARIVVRGSLGEHVPAWRASFLSALTGERLPALADLAPGDDGRVGPLPPGRYRVEIVPRAQDTSASAWLPALAPHALDVRAGATSDADVQLVTGAALRIELALEGPPPADFAFRPDRDPKKQFAIDAARRAHEQAHAATVRLVPVDPPGSPRLVSFEVPAENADAPPSVASTLLPGRSANVFGPLAPGVYRVAVDAPGFAPGAAELRVTAGGRHALRVALRAP